MRFEVSAAYAMGIGLPLLETLRRKTNFDNFHSYVDDFIIWAVLCGGLYGSFFWQLFSTEALDISGLPNTTVIIVKGVLYAIALTALVFASRSAIHTPALPCHTPALPSHTPALPSTRQGAGSP